MTRLIYLSLFVAAGTGVLSWDLAVKVTTASLRGIHNVGRGVIWASGANGTVLRSEDDGYLWQTCTLPADAVKLDFRAIYGWDANHVDVMSSGAGALSRLYETTDGGATWQMLFENPDAAGFWDALTFRGNSGYILGDPVDGRFVLYRSDDQGHHWHRENAAGLTATEGEGAFAASNSSLVALPNSKILFVTGGKGGPRVFRSDMALQWTAAKVPMAGGKESAGIFSLAFRDSTHGAAVGGDYQNPSATAGTAAWTSDAGATWHAATRYPSGYRSSVAWDDALHAWIAVGPNGSDLSRDDGRTWERFDSGECNALSLPWVAGPKGRLASLNTGGTPQ